MLCRLVKQLGNRMASFGPERFGSFWRVSLSTEGRLTRLEFHHRQVDHGYRFVFPAEAPPQTSWREMCVARRWAAKELVIRFEGTGIS